MKSDETSTLSLAAEAPNAPHKFRQFLRHPFTFIVLVWMGLLLLFCVVAEFI